MVQKILFVLVCLGWSCSFAQDSYCAFCDREVLERQTFYEDDLVLALYTHKPVLPAHFLIMPKRHVEHFDSLSDEEILQIGRVTKKVNEASIKAFGTSSYFLLQKNGKESGQSVPHVHFHYIAKKEGDYSVFKILFKLYTDPLFSPIKSDAMQVVVEKMKDAMD